MQNPSEKPDSLLSLPKRTNGPVQAKFRKIVIDSNRYKVDASKLTHLCIFAIKFTPHLKQDQSTIKQEIIQKITPQIKQFIEEPIIKESLIFSSKIPKLKNKTIVHNEYVIFIRQINRFDAQKNPEMIQYFLGNVMKKLMQKLHYVQVGSSKKFINQKKCMQMENTLIFSGFKLSFEMLENGYYLTVDTTMKIVRNQSVLQYMNYLYKTHSNMDRDEKREMMKKQLIGRIVMTNYGKTRYLRIQDVFFTDITQVVIQSCKLYLPEYYRSRYNIEINNLKQPLLFANTKKTNIKTYLVPELCLMTGIPEDFDESKNKKITESAKLTSDARKIEIDNFVKNMNSLQEGDVFSSLNVKINSNSQKIEGKIIPAPKIIFGEGKILQSSREGNFAMNDTSVFRARQKQRMAIVAFDGIDTGSIVQYFTNSFRFLKVKMEVTIIKSGNFNQKRGMELINFLIDKAKNQQNCDICLIIIPNKMKHLYQKIKEITLLQSQIGCQVVLEGTLKNKNLHSVTLKIYLQILAKGGNTLWAAAPSSRKQKIMLVAYYSCELARLKTNYYTLGICATCDDLYTEIYSRTCKYLKEHQELQCMIEMLLQALAHYKKRNGFIPQDIIILKNQKSTRNEKSIVQFFIQPSIRHLQEVYGNRRPKIVYIIARKSLHDRFFKTFQDKNINPPIGTLINSHLIASKFQFYMISHDIMKKGGSIIPLNYKVIFSDSDIQQGVIYCLLYSQCFSYANQTGAIRQPGLLQYVMKCTKFGAQVLLNSQVGEKFRMCPYYI